jgi:hypothetical protein
MITKFSFGTRTWGGDGDDTGCGDDDASDSEKEDSEEEKKRKGEVRLKNLKSQIVENLRHGRWSEFSQHAFSGQP